VLSKLAGIPGEKVLRNQSPSPLVACTVGCIPESGLTIVNDALIKGGF
jgi:hypothetical protein